MSQPTSTEKSPPSFPGGSRVTGEPLRIAIDKKAYADVIGHAVLEPDVEVCGVLVGFVRSDTAGPWIHITHSIRGEAAKQQGVQVTFTHETWNHIHSEMDRHHADKQIVGWYHTHGGFGIFLSEMDTFIHKNFFSELHQVAYVFDPLAGTEGFFRNAGEKFEPVRRYWLGGRERIVAALKELSAESDEPSAGLAQVARALERTATAMATSRERGSDLTTTLLLGLGVAAVVLLGTSFFTGQSLFGGARAAETSEPGTLLIVERDREGRAVGVELKGVDHEEGPVFRDSRGRLYVGVESGALEDSLRGRGASKTPEKRAARREATPGVRRAAGRVRSASAGWASWIGIGAVCFVGGWFAGSYGRRLLPRRKG